MKVIVKKNVDPTNGFEAQNAATGYYGHLLFTPCQRKKADLTVILKWNVKWARVKSRSYYFRDLTK